MAKKAWMIGIGHEGLSEEAEAEATATGPRRYWMPVTPQNGVDSDGREIVFLDDEPPRFKEHQIQIQGNWFNFATCPGPEECPLCQVGHKPYYAAAWTVIDRNEYKGKDGRVYKDQLRLFIAKFRVAKLLDRETKFLKTKKGVATGLAGLVYNVVRTDEKSPNTGDSFKLVAQAGASLLKGKKIVDYGSVLDVNLGELRRFAAIFSGSNTANDSGRSGAFA